MATHPSYTAEEHETWRCFHQEASRLWARHSSLIHSTLGDQIHRLKAFADHIPSLQDIQAALAEIGWTACYVEGLAPAWDIARLLDQKTLPISARIRGRDEIHFAREPDLIHDMFGHFPALFDPRYRALLERWARAASSVAIEESDRASYHINKLIVTMHGRVDGSSLNDLKQASQNLQHFIEAHQSRTLIFEKAYFWIFEFGLLSGKDGVKVVGAGLFSSLSEMDKIAACTFPSEALTVSSLLSPYHVSEEQDRYLLAEGYADFHRILDQLITSCDDGRGRHYA